MSKPGGNTATLNGKSKECTIGKPHVSPFVGNGCTTMRTRHLDGQDAFVRLISRPPRVQFRIVKVQPLQRGWVVKFDIFFLKNGDPFKGRSVE